MRQISDARSQERPREAPHPPVPQLLVAVRALIVAGIACHRAAGHPSRLGVYYNKVHSGVKRLRARLGGLTRDEATRPHATVRQEAQNKPITLTSGDKTWEVMPADVGTEIDVAGAVSAAMDVTRDSNFFADVARRFKLYFSDDRHPPLRHRRQRR